MKISIFSLKKSMMFWLLSMLSKCLSKYAEAVKYFCQMSWRMGQSKSTRFTVDGVFRTTCSICWLVFSNWLIDRNVCVCMCTELCTFVHTNDTISHQYVCMCVCETRMTDLQSERDSFIRLRNEHSSYLLILILYNG